MDSFPGLLGGLNEFTLQGVEQRLDHQKRVIYFNHSMDVQHPAQSLVPKVLNT